MFKRVILALALVGALALSVEAQTQRRVAAKISSQTTTALVSAVAGQSVYVSYLSACVDGNGATTGIALVDSGSTNLVGTSVVYVLLAGQCIEFLGSQLNPTTGGTGLSITTTVGNGPVEVNSISVQR